MAIFLTGWNGYVGSAVVRAAQAARVPLTVLVRSPAEAQTAVAAGLVPAIGALDDGRWLAARVADASAVIHCAASDNPAFQPLSLAAITAMLGGLDTRAALVVHGGSLVFGPTGPEPARPTALAPPPFLTARAAIDQALLDAAAAGRNAAGVYGSFVHGGGRGAMIPASWAVAARALGHVPVPGDGEAVWAHVHVDDWGRLLLATALAGATGPIFAAAGNSRVADLAARLGEALGLPVMSAEPSAAGPFGPTLTLDQAFDPAPALALGWTPTQDLAATVAEGLD